MSLITKNTGLVIYLAALSAFAPFSTDIYLASMPTIQHSFNTSASNVQLTLSLFFIGFAIAQLFWGPLSDRIGRKPVIFIGLSIFVLASLFCAWSTTISWLIIARVVQAIGACSGLVIAISIVKDSFANPKDISKILGVMMSIMIVAPMIAPIIGSYMLVHVNWQSNFYFLALYGFVLITGAYFINESHPESSRKPLPINRLLSSYLKQICCGSFLLPTIAISTNFSAMFAFISSSSFIYIKVYHLATYLFGYFFAANAAALILGSLSLNILKDRFRDNHIIFAAILISLFGSLLMLTTLHFYPHSIWSVVIPSFIITYGIGILNPELTGQALKHVIAHTGLASSLIGTCRFILAAAIAFLMGVLITSSALPLAIVMLILNILTAVCMLLYTARQ